MTLEELHLGVAEVNKNSMWLSEGDRFHYTSAPMCLHIVNSPVRAEQTQPADLHCFSDCLVLSVQDRCVCV